MTLVNTPGAPAENRNKSATCRVTIPNTQSEPDILERASERAERPTAFWGRPPRSRDDNPHSASDFRTVRTHRCPGHGSCYWERLLDKNHAQYAGAL